MTDHQASTDPQAPQDVRRVTPSEADSTGTATG